jgi:hypothetical protein
LNLWISVCTQFHHLLFGRPLSFLPCGLLFLIDWLIDWLALVSSPYAPMHLGPTDRPFVIHNLISAQESPVPLPKFQMAPNRIFVKCLTYFYLCRNALGGRKVLPLQHFVSQIRFSLSLLDVVIASSALELVCPHSSIYYFVSCGLC